MLLLAPNTESFYYKKLRNHMKLQLILNDNCTSCAHTITVWREIGELYGSEFEVLELGSAKGAKLVMTHNLKVFPVLLIDGKVAAVGSPDKTWAMAIIEKHVGQIPLTARNK
jgi:hypothetical protein